MSLNSLPMASRKHCKHANKSSKPRNAKVALSDDEQKEYESSDSLDQLLDNAFIPSKSQPEHMRSRNTPNKSIRASGGGKRAQALALMASTGKSMKTRCKSSRKQQFKNVCKQLQSRDSENEDDNHADEDAHGDHYAHTTHVVLQTPALKPRLTSTTTKLAAFSTSRDIMTPTPYKHALQFGGQQAARFMTTPRKSDALKLLQTPCTPTPVKLMRTLNVRTPKHIDARQTRIKQNRPHAPKPTARAITTTALPSWQDATTCAAAESNKDEATTKAVTWDTLVARTQRLALPLKWTTLLRKFNALESMLSLFMRKNSFFVHFSQVEHSVQSVTKKKFTPSDLQQMLTVVPEFHHVQWTACVEKQSQRKQLKLTLTALDFDPYRDQQTDALAYSGDDDEDGSNITKKPTKVDEHQKTEKATTTKEDKQEKVEDKKKTKEESKMERVGIKFLRVSKLGERERVFRHRLIELVAQHHQAWLRDNALIEFDPLQTGKWHKNFELESVREIELTPLPTQPQKSTNDIERMIADQKAKLQSAIDAEMQRLKKSTNTTQKELSIPAHLKHLSPSLILKIRAKQEHKQNINAKELGVLGKRSASSKCGSESAEEQSRWQQLPYLVQLMRGIYVSMKKSSLPCNELVKLIKRRHRNPHVIPAEIWMQLQMLSKLKSGFFHIKQGSMVKVAKINKSVATKDVLQEINGNIKK